jgi:hypothetical protein
LWLNLRFGVDRLSARTLAARFPGHYKARAKELANFPISTPGIMANFGGEGGIELEALS